MTRSMRKKTTVVDSLAVVDAPAADAVAAETTHQAAKVDETEMMKKRRKRLRQYAVALHVRSSQMGTGWVRWMKQNVADREVRMMMTMT